MSSNRFLQQLIDDLKDFSAELLAPGLQTGQQLQSDGLGSIASHVALLKSIDLLTNLLPQLLDELQTMEATHKAYVHYSSTPKRARFSPRPNHYQRHGNQLLPRQWLQLQPIEELDPAPLRWLLHLLDLQAQALDKVLDRTSKYIDNSLRQQQGRSDFARHDRATLLGMRQRLYDAQARISHAQMAIMRRALKRLLPNPTPPNPYPHSSAWQRLRQYAQQLINPTEALPTALYSLFYGNIEVADTPYLYQRWCGIKLLDAFIRLDWRVSGDPVGALFLGGEIKLWKQDLKVNIWVEPRFVRHHVHLSGFTCSAGAETHPDYMIVAPGPCGVDAFILDPTTTADFDVRQSKAKYLTSIETTGSVAGTSVVRHPLRAWSAAPLHSSHCELNDPTGQTGTVPMHPLDWNDQPLSLWVKDIDDYALAWGHHHRMEYETARFHQHDEAA